MPSARECATTVKVYVCVCVYVLSSAAGAKRLQERKLLTRACTRAPAHVPPTYAPWIINDWTRVRIYAYIDNGERESFVFDVLGFTNYYI